MADWSKGLRSEGSTPRSRTIVQNKRYSGHFDDSDIADTAETPPQSSRSRTPKQGPNWTPTPSSLSRTPRSAGRLMVRTPSSAQKTILGDDSSPGRDHEGSVCSDDVSIITEEDCKDSNDGESVQVFVRVRPANVTELAESGNYGCLQVLGSRKVVVDLKSRFEPYEFNFDWVLPDTSTQSDVFDVAGTPIVDNCMAGYNSSIFAYGQTGAGKTYTMQGRITGGSHDDKDKRGLAPRVFEYLFKRIDKEQDEKGHDALKFCCRVSMLEIYNEVITDLFNPAGTNLQIREDMKRGCYVEGLSEEGVQNSDDAMRLMQRGAEARHVGETRLNRESSRSHSVFTCTVERHTKSDNGLTNILFSRLNLIDLAGSERVRSGAHGGSGAVGEHFKEACHINKSLTTLGRVIMELVEAQRSGRRGRHVPYRDSRLTFLLQDSLGGNAKTMIIANISPSSVCAQETLSTLYFVRRAKHIRNKATINVDTRGDVALLQKEIIRLNTELDNLRKGFTDPAIQENKELRSKLLDNEAHQLEMQLKLDAVNHDNSQLKRERKRMDQKMVYIQSTACQLQQLLFTLMMRMEKYEHLNQASAHCARVVTEVEGETKQVTQMNSAAAQHEEQLGDLNARMAQQAAMVAAAETAVAQLKEKLADVQAQRDHALGELHQESERCEEAMEHAEATTRQLQEQAAAMGTLQQELERAEHQAEETAQQLNDANGRLVEASATALEVQANIAQQQEEQQAAKAALNEQLAAAHAELEQQATTFRDQLAAMQKKFEAAQAMASQSESELCKQLEDYRIVTEGLQHELKDNQAQSEQLKQQVEELHGQIAAKDEAAAESAEALQISKDISTDLDNQVKSLMEQEKTLLAHLAVAEAATRNLGEQLADTTSELELQRQQRSISEDSFNKLSEELEGLKRSLAVTEARLKEQQGMAAKAAEDMEADRYQLKEQLGLLKEQLAQVSQQLQEEQEAHQQDRSDAASHLEGLQEQLAAGKEAAEVAQQKLQYELNATKEGARVTEGSLQEELEAVRQQLEAKEQELAAARAEIKAGEDELSSSGNVARVREEQLQQQLTAAQANAEAKESELQRQLIAQQQAAKVLEEELREQFRNSQKTAEQREQDLLAKMREAQQECQGREEELQQALAEEQRQLANTRRQLDELKVHAAEQKEALEEKSNKLAEVEGQVKQLKNQLADANAAAAAKADQMEGDLVASEQAHRSRQEALRQQITELATKCSHLQQEKEQLEDKADSDASELALLRDQLAAAQTSSSSMASELATTKAAAAELQQKVAVEADAHAAALMVIVSRDKEIADLKRQVTAAEVASQGSQLEHSQQIRALQRELMEGQDILGQKQFEMNQLQKEAESLSHRLSERTKDLVARKEEGGKLKAQLSRSTTENAEKDKLLKEKESLIEQLSREHKVVNQERQQLLQERAEAESKWQGKLSETELRWKEDLVQRAKVGRAFGEIRRIIDWAGYPERQHSETGGSMDFGRPGSSNSLRLARGGSGSDPNRTSYGSIGLHQGLVSETGHGVHSQMASGLLVEEEPQGCTSPRGGAYSERYRSAASSPYSLKSAAHRSIGPQSCSSHAIQQSMDHLAVSQDGVLLSMPGEWGVDNARRSGRDSKRECDQLPQCRER